jgi:hypothetical protein
MSIIQVIQPYKKKKEVNSGKRLSYVSGIYSGVAAPFKKIKKELQYKT